MSTHERANGLGSKVILATALAALGAGGVGACGVGDDSPRSSGGPAAVNGNTGDGGGSAICEGDETQACKVWIDENNCFVGVQQCHDGAWGDCVEGDDLGGASFDTKSISTSGNCPNNPCNPECQQFDEDPAMDLTAPGSPPPPVATATINDLASSWANACLQDMAHACNSQCTSSGYCQFDTYCDTPPGNLCTPWGTGEFESGSGDPNFTIGVVCNPSAVSVCNRGDTAGGMGVGISTWTPNNQLCGDNCGSQPYTTGQSGVSNQRGTCTIPTDIAPGDCIAVDCSGAISGQTMLHVNGCDQFACVPESDRDDNYGIYDPSTQCQCAANNQTAGLAPVTLFMVLDNSGSMVSRGLWDPAKTAVKAFIADPGSDTINFAMRMYGDNPTSGCDSSSCSTNACKDMAYGPTLLSDATFETNVINYIDTMSTGGNGTPHHPSTKGLYEAAEEYAQANPSALVATVYISDGSYPAQCGQTISHMGGHAADANVNDGVLSFSVALQGADLALLDELALQGGTTEAIDLTMSTNVAADLTAELQGIQASLFSCTIAIPNAASVDPGAVTVAYLPSAGGSTPLTEVANSGACSGGNQFYFEPDNVNPTDITLCPTLCTTVQGDPGADVELAGGCAGTYVADSQVFDYTPDCSAFGTGARPLWEHLSFDTDVPGDATVVWEVSTSNVSAADAAMGPWTTVATSTFANPDAAPSSPVDLETYIGALTQQTYLAIQITLNPSSGGLATPTVFDWLVTYSCTSSE